MKKYVRIIILCLVVLLAFTLTACDKPDKIVKDENGNIIKKTVYTGNDVLYIHTYEYNPSGQRTAFKEYGSDNELDYYAEYEYDQEGRTIKTHVHTDNMGGEEYEIAFEYWPNGKEKSAISTYLDGRTKEIQEFTEEGNRSKWIEYRSSETIERIFDENGNKVEEIITESWSGKKTIKKFGLDGKTSLESKYDKNGKLISEKAY